MNAFAKALDEGKFFVGGVCGDCRSVLVNGDASGNDPDWNEFEFNRVCQEYDITPGHPHNFPQWEHEIGCGHGSKPCPDDADCDCQDRGFRTSPCDACGTYLHGDRYDFTFVACSDMED
jgi:hypothetical protein